MKISVVKYLFVLMPRKWPLPSRPPAKMAADDRLKPYPYHISPLSLLGHVAWELYNSCSTGNDGKSLILIHLFTVAMASLIARFMGPTWGPSGADRTQVGPMLAPWTLLSGFVLTHWGHTKWPTFFQMAFPNASSWMKMLEFRLKFHWGLFLSVQLMIFQHCFRWWLVADQATSYYLKQWWLSLLTRIYASPSLNELNGGQADI